MTFERLERIRVNHAFTEEELTKLLKLCPKLTHVAVEIDWGTGTFEVGRLESMIKNGPLKNMVVRVMIRDRWKVKETLLKRLYELHCSRLFFLEW